MQFIIYTEDKDDGLTVRQANRQAHLEWLKTDLSVTVLAAGPWLDDGGVMRGSLLIVDAPDKQTLTAWTQRDPYAKAGLSKSVTIKPFKWVIGAPV